jgi:hypothetical protein
MTVHSLSSERSIESPSIAHRSRENVGIELRVTPREVAGLPIDVTGLTGTAAMMVGPEVAMATCKSCGEEADQLVTVKVGGKAKKLCEDCADRAREEAEVAEASESVVQNMMGFKGRR